MAPKCLSLCMGNRNAKLRSCTYCWWKYIQGVWIHFGMNLNMSLNYEDYNELRKVFIILLILILV